MRIFLDETYVKFLLHSRAFINYNLEDSPQFYPEHRYPLTDLISLIYQSPKDAAKFVRDYHDVGSRFNQIFLTPNYGKKYGFETNE
jgi:hypothetical protein